MKKKQNHFKYIKQEGKFKLLYNRIIFSKQVIETLKEFGHWFAALANGTLKPFNTKQEEFIKAAHSRKSPSTDYEKLWSKYLRCIEIEKKAGNPLYAAPQIEDNTFYSRDMAKDLKNIIKVTKENHRE